MEKINNNGNEKSEHIFFYNFYFQKKYKRNMTKAIRNTQIGCLTVTLGSMPGGGARGQNLGHLQKVGFLC